MLTKGKSLITLVLIFLTAAGNFSASGEITQKQVNDAVKISIRAQIVYGTPTIIGKKTKGVDSNDNVFTYLNCDISELNKKKNVAPTEYTHISGTVTLEGGALIFDVTLKGGPISTLKFKVDLDALENLNADNKPIMVTADGKSFTYDLASFKDKK